MALSRDEATIREGSVCAVYFQLWREDKHGVKTKVHLDVLSALVLDYFNHSSGAAINSRSDQNVKNANNVTVSDFGEVKWTMQAADTAATATDGTLERHVAVFKWTLTDGMIGSHRMDLYIEADSKV